MLNKLPDDRMVVYQYWCINNHHISEGDFDKLHETPLFQVDPAADGLWVQIPTTRDEDSIDALLQSIRFAGFSSAVTLIMTIAIDHDISAIRFSAAMPNCSFLNHYHW